MFTIKDNKLFGYDLGPRGLWNPANKFTISRLPMGIPGVVAFVMGFTALAFVLWVLAASTDWFDGRVARKTGSTSDFGAVLDPSIDKLSMLVLGVLALFYASAYGVACIVAIAVLEVATAAQSMRAAGMEIQIRVVNAGKWGIFWRASAVLFFLGAARAGDMAETIDWFGLICTILGILTGAKALMQYNNQLEQGIRTKHG